MLLQDFFASARPHKPQKKKKIPKRAVNYSYYLKSNNIIDQMKATVTEKNRFIRDWFKLFNLKYSCTYLILINSKHLLHILYNYCTNWLRVISCQEQIITSWKHTRITIFMILKSKSGIPEYKNGKKNIWTSIFFFHETML